METTKPYFINPFKPYSALVIGAGNIGALYDKPGSTAVLTHAHALTASAHFNLTGFVDADWGQAQRAAEQWQTHAYPTLADAFNAQAIDLVVIATPDKTHHEVLKAVAERPVKLVFCEKPVTETSEQARQIIELYQTRQIGLSVNYLRRFVKAFEPVRQAIRHNEWGRFLGGNGYYGKGLRHTGSHLLQQLLDWFDTAECLQAFSAVNDYTADDPSISAVLRLGEGCFSLHAIADTAYSVYEIDLLFERQRVQVMNAGRTIIMSNIQADVDFPAFSVLNPAPAQSTEYENALTHAFENLSGYLNKTQTLLCTGQHAQYVLALCESIHAQATGCF